MAKTIVYNGGFEGFLCAVFDVYEYRFADVNIVPAQKHQPSLFAEPHLVNFDLRHSDRVWKGLQKRLTPETQEQLYCAFLSELPGIENTLLQYIQAAFEEAAVGETALDKAIPPTISQAAKAVRQEEQRVKKLMRFQQTADGLLYAVAEPNHNILPLLTRDMQARFAKNRWMLYDARRRYGVYSDSAITSPVQIQFSNAVANDKTVLAVYQETEEIYRQLWKKSFKTVNMPAVKSAKLYILQLPANDEISLPNKTQTSTGGLQERLTNWTYRRA